MEKGKKDIAFKYFSCHSNFSSLKLPSASNSARRESGGEKRERKERV